MKEDLTGIICAQAGPWVEPMNFRKPAGWLLHMKDFYLLVGFVPTALLNKVKQELVSFYQTIVKWSKSFRNTVVFLTIILNKMRLLK